MNQARLKLFLPEFDFQVQHIPVQSQRNGLVGLHKCLIEVTNCEIHMIYRPMLSCSGLFHSFLR